MRLGAALSMLVRKLSFFQRRVRSPDLLTKVAWSFGKKSPLSQVYGWGLSGPVPATELDRVEAFYRSRGLKPRVRVCPLADPSFLQILDERQYIDQEHMNIMIPNNWTTC